ncbi:MAG TPA: DUF4292 domain-containing protein [Lentimicrobium sp.]|nr:DUF4292 domain-containing protein [Lentimicrobium sp.]
MSKLRLLILFFGVLILTASCSTSRRAIREPLKEQGAEFLFNNLKTNELNFNFFSAKFNADIRINKKSNQITGQIRIKRDSAIWISISPLMGIEMARLMITNDSVKYLNRIETTYFTGTFEHINKLINSTLDFDMLQSFLTGNDFSRYENTSFKGGIDAMQYTLQTTNRRKLKKFVKSNDDIQIPIQHIWLEPETFKIVRIMIREASANGRKAEAKYTHEKISDQLVPVNINFEVETSSEKSEMKIQYSKITIDQELQFPFKIPDKYNKIGKL